VVSRIETVLQFNTKVYIGNTAQNQCFLLMGEQKTLIRLATAERYVGIKIPFLQDFFSIGPLWA
jgi:hypothetical protein